MLTFMYDHSTQPMPSGIALWEGTGLIVVLAYRKGK